MRMQETTMGAALMAAGVRPGEVRLKVALSEYLNTGGTIARLRQIVDEIAEEMAGGANDGMPDRGRTVGASSRQTELMDGCLDPSAREGLPTRAPIHQPEDAAGAVRRVPAEGQNMTAPAASPDREQDDGQTGRAGNGHSRRASPVREQSPADRAAMLTAARNAALAVLKIDGIDIRRYTVGQCLSMAREKGRDAYVLRVLGNRYKHLPHTTEIGVLAGEGDLLALFRQAEAHAEEAA